MRPVVVLPPTRSVLVGRSINGLLRDYPELAEGLRREGLDPAAVGGASLREYVEPSRLDSVAVTLEAALEWREHAELRGAIPRGATP